VEVVEGQEKQHLLLLILVLMVDQVVVVEV
jgi:hypothetical protein